MPEIIDLEETEKHCPFDASILKKVIYFRDPMGADENGDPLKNIYICIVCGFRGEFYSPVMIQEFIDRAAESIPKKAELLDLKNKMKDSRIRHNDRRPLHS